MAGNELHAAPANMEMSCTLHLQTWKTASNFHDVGRAKLHACAHLMWAHQLRFFKNMLFKSVTAVRVVCVSVCVCMRVYAYAIEGLYRR
jgi:hypothetical protein